MNIHEYQAKELLQKYGVATPRGFPCVSAAEAVQAAERLGAESWMVKAQIHSCGRQKAGGVKLARSIDELRELAGGMLGSRLVTAQTGPAGRVVRRLLVEETVEIRKELYLGLTLDRSRQLVALIASDDGGMDIDQVAALTPERIFKIHIDPFTGLKDKDADDVAHKLGVPDASLPDARPFIQGFWKAFDESEAFLAEINPLALTRDGRLIALDAKIDLDPSALFRHPELAALRDPEQENPAEIEAARHELSYVSLRGDIGCLVNGAGLAMATMDAIKLYGGAPANFLDVGGGATTQRVAEAFKIMLDNPSLKAILVNIFGGIMRCDIIAQGLVEAARQSDLTVPLVVRMKGTNELAGKKILSESGLRLITASNMGDAAEKVVNAAKGR